jgi:lipopolysaccharide transport system permease protein
MTDLLITPLKQIWDFRDLLVELVSRELKVRYRRSILGFGWSLLTPIYQIVIYTVVLKYIVHMEEDNLSVKILAGIIPWTYFSVSVLNACPSVLRYRGVIKKVYFPRQFLPMAVVASNLIHLVLCTLILFAVFIGIGVAFRPDFAFLFVLVILETLLVCGLSFLAACAHTYFQDIEYVLTNLFQVGMFLTPVLYPASKIEHLAPIYRHLFWLNPMAVYTEGWRGILLRGELPDPMYLGIAAAVSIFFFVIGLIVWQRFEWRFPEVL